MLNTYSVRELDTRPVKDVFMLQKEDKAGHMKTVVIDVDGGINMEDGNENRHMKIGVIDVGGGLRGIYAAGVLDYCMEQGIRFDLGIGISYKVIIKYVQKI